MVLQDLLIFKNYWYAGIGALIGFIITLYVSNIRRARKINKDKNLAKEALINRLTFNNDRILQMLGQFGGGKETPNYLFDTTGIIIWLSLSSELFSEQLISDINWHRYQLDHLNSKLSTYYLTISTFQGNNLELHKAIKEQSLQSIVLQLKKVSGAFCPLIQKIDKVNL